MFASNVLGSSVTFIFSTLASFLVYGAVLGYMFAVVGQPGAADEPGGRRAFLKRAAVFGALAVAGVYGVRWLFNQAGENMSASSTHRVRGVLSSEVTPNDQFYTVSKNFIDPDVRLSDWSLAIDGLVDKPRVFEFDELRAMPAVERYVTLECISNIVGGDLISNALWEGRAAQSAHGPGADRAGSHRRGPVGRGRLLGEPLDGQAHAGRDAGGVRDERSAPAPLARLPRQADRARLLRPQERQVAHQDRAGCRQLHRLLAGPRLDRRSDRQGRCPA